MSKLSKYTLVYSLCLPTFVLSLYFEENRLGVVTFLNHHDYHTRLLTHDNDSVPFLVCLFVCVDAFFGPEQNCSFSGRFGLLKNWYLRTQIVYLL